MSSLISMGQKAKEASYELGIASAGQKNQALTFMAEELVKAKDEIIKANNNLTESNKSNNWALVGQDIEKLQSLINELEKLKNEEVFENAVGGAPGNAFCNDPGAFSGRLRTADRMRK